MEDIEEQLTDVLAEFVQEKCLEATEAAEILLLLKTRKKKKMWLDFATTTGVLTSSNLIMAALQISGKKKQK